MKYLFVLFISLSIVNCVAAVGEPLGPKYQAEGCTSVETNPPYEAACSGQGTFVYAYTGCKTRPADCVLPYGATSMEKTENDIFCCK